MKVLIVANNKREKALLASFVYDQIDALRAKGVIIDTFGVSGKGILGYIKGSSNLRKKINEFQPDVIHAHYGLCGLLANMQRRVPVVTTYHGSDIHSGGWILALSKLTTRLSAYNIFVSTKMLKMSGYRKENACVLSCGVDFNTIREIPKEEARRLLGIAESEKIVLFSSEFARTVKNYALARSAMDLVPEAKLIELSGYSREQLCLLMNACDVQLVTSFRESGPLVVKEAMACGTPVVSVDVGDVLEIVGDTEGCYIAERTPEDVADKIKKALVFKGKTNGRQRIVDLNLSNDCIANKLISIYNEVIGRRTND